MPCVSTSVQIKKYLKKKKNPIYFELSIHHGFAFQPQHAGLLEGLPSAAGWAAKGAVSGSPVAPNIPLANKDMCGNYCFYAESTFSC